MTNPIERHSLANFPTSTSAEHGNAALPMLFTGSSAYDISLYPIVRIWLGLVTILLKRLTFSILSHRSPSPSSPTLSSIKTVVI